MDACIVNGLGRQRWYVLLEQRLSMHLPIIRQGWSHKLVWVDIHVAHSFHTHECRGLENWYTWHCWSCPEWQSWVFCASPESCICYPHPRDWLATISAPKEGRASDSPRAGQCRACHRTLACYMQPASCCCSSLVFHGSNVRPCYCPAS